MARKKRRVRRQRKTYVAGVLRRRIGGHARRMARALRALNAVPDKEPRCRLSPSALIINYGCSTRPSWLSTQTRWLNPPHSVAASSDKLTALRAFNDADVPTLEWTTNQPEVLQWLSHSDCKGNAGTVFARKILRGSRGDGIVVLKRGDAVPYAPLYTRNFPKTHEFRVHVAGGRVLDIVEKKARNDTEVDRSVRNHSGGWVFAHDNLSVDSTAFDDISVRAVACLGLDFGAVDVLAILSSDNPRRVKKAVVCEVNSSPAWECTATFNSYMEYFRGAINAASAQNRYGQLSRHRW